MARGKPFELQPAIVIPLYSLLAVAIAHGGSKNPKYNSAFFLLITAICIYHIFFTASENAVGDYGSAMNASGIFFYASDYILLRDRQPELRQIGQKKPTSEMSFWERLKWGFSLSMTPRTLGWSTEPTSHIRPRPQSTRFAFVASQLAWMFFYYLMMDITAIVTRSIPIYAKNGPTFTEYGPWIWRTTIWNHILNTYALLSLIYTTASVVTVLLGIYQPRDWPHLFGYFFKDGYTVRNIWGRVWHQMLRKPLTGHADALVDILRLPKSTFTTYFKLYVAFFLSGVIHYAGDYMLKQDWKGQSVTFFVLQAVGITFEDAVVALTRRAGLSRPNFLFKLVGFFWVFIWFSFSIPIWLERNFHAGSVEDIPSLVMGLWKGDWMPKRV